MASHDSATSGAATSEEAAGRQTLGLGEQSPEQRDEAARGEAAAMLEQDAATQALGIVILDVAVGRATAVMTVTAAMVQGHGSCHGGYLFLVADTAFAFACNTHGVATVAQGADVEFVAPAREGDRLVATAVERVLVGRSGVCDVTVTREADGQVVAEFRGRSRAVGRAPSDG